VRRLSHSHTNLLQRKIILASSRHYSLPFAHSFVIPPFHSSQFVFVVVHSWFLALLHGAQPGAGSDKFGQNRTDSVEYAIGSDPAVASREDFPSFNFVKG
jgi:hypothetical protein